MYLTAHTIGALDINADQARRVAAIYVQDGDLAITRANAAQISEHTPGTRVYERYPVERPYTTGLVRAYVDFVAVDDITVEELTGALDQLEERVSDPYARYAIWIEAQPRWILRFSMMRGLTGVELPELAVLREDLIGSLEAWAASGRPRELLQR